VVALAAVSTALLLAGCGSTGETGDAAATTEAVSSAPDPTDTLSPDAAAEPTEGSVTTADGSFVEYPNGLRLEIAKVELDPEFGERNAAVGAGGFDYSQGLHVTVLFTNNGTDVYPLNKEFGGITVGVTFGVNQYEASGYMFDDTLPSQLVPGSSATNTYDFTLPPAGVEDDLRVSVTPDASLFTTYTFTDVQTLLG
jgi:hypothetical protein